MLVKKFCSTNRLARFSKLPFTPTVGSKAKAYRRFNDFQQFQYYSTAKKTPPASPSRIGESVNPKTLNTDIHKEKKKKRNPIFSFLKKTFLGLGSIGLAAYLYDNTLGTGITNRSIGSLYTLLLISADYKLNFDEDHDIEALHERNAQRLYDLLIHNKGLYIKMGQMIAIQGVMFPKQYQQKFSQLFDKAPREPWSTADSILKSELGENYRDEVFEYIEEEPIASASIAQVHKARLKNGGADVAVKIQKDSVSKQVEVDLLTYRLVMAIYEYVFEMPLSVTVNYICDKMRNELDFENELANGEKISALINSNPDFKGHVYIPKCIQNKFLNGGLSIVIYILVI
ncbi:unnamed protein product [Ambrosiozyma monospora]|uniref:Unnamed protein product n=1 Tax=Ambrosiozyma monospora TaxID=43982 RepID=A0ACB5TYP0_AMBMO|nr:unnamed protein product [Ambrosiozyma monospora]